MKFIVNGAQIKDLKGWIFCDTDFLSLLSQDEIFLEEALALFPRRLILDPFTEVEFLRNVFLPAQRILKEKIIEKAFTVAERHQEIFTKTVSSCLELSRIYAHKDKGVRASLVDLLLAGRMVNASYDACIVTGNSKDFPSIVFDTISVINYEQNDGTMRAISVLKFSKEKYDIALADYSKMLKKHNESFSVEN